MLVAWSTWTSLDGRADVHGVILDASGRPATAPFAIATGPGDDDRPAAAGGDDGYLVAWRGPGEVRAVYLTPHGWAPAPAGRRIATSAVAGDAPAVARGDGGYLVAWTDDDAAGRVVWARAIDAAGVPVAAARVIARCDGACARPRAAWGAARYLVAWDDVDGAGTARVRAVRVDAAGAPDGALALDAIGDAAAVASDGDAWLIASTSAAPDALVVTRVDAAGRVVGAPRPIAPAAEATALAWAGDRYVAVWVAGGWITAAELDAGGAVVPGSVHDDMAAVADVALAATPDGAIAGYALPAAIVVARPIALAPGPPAGLTGGCDCRAGGEPGAWLAGVVLVVLGVGRPRRRGRARTPRPLQILR